MNFYVAWEGLTNSEPYRFPLGCIQTKVKNILYFAERVVFGIVLSCEQHQDCNLLYKNLQQN